MSGRTTANLFCALIFAAAAHFSSAAPSPAPAPAPAVDCMSSIVTMSDCLSYVEAGSNRTRPEKACCSELAGMVKSSPSCLCEMAEKSGSFGVSLNMTRALALPSVCKVSTPPLTDCAAVGVPVGVPTSAEGAPPVPGIMSPGGATPTGAAGIVDAAMASFGCLAISFLVTLFRHV